MMRETGGAGQFSAAAPQSTCDLPLVRGRIVEPITWFVDRDQPDEEIATARIIVPCPYCGRDHVHGWELTGERRTEERVAHCHAGHYRVTTAALRLARHALSPLVRMSRPTRQCRPFALPAGA